MTKVMLLSNHAKQYYSYQTRARGLLDEKALRQQFQKMAKWYGKRLHPYLPAAKSAACLDVPCGFGNFLYFLKQRGYDNAHGYDLDPAQVELARLLELPACEGDVFEILSGQSEFYAMISSLDFIEHVSKDDALQFLALCWQRLKPGGVLLLRAPCADGPFGAHDRHNDLTHQWGITSNLLRAILEMQGFDKIELLDERPQPTGFIDTLRWLVFFPARALATLFCMALGMSPPRIWSRSMFAVAHKPDAEKAGDK